MTTEFLNPDGIFKPQTYWQASISEGTKIIHISGQVAWDKDGQTVGINDLAAQTAQAYTNVALALQSIGATFENIAKIHVYVVDWSIEKRPAYREGRDRVAKLLDIDLKKPTTLIGVTALAEPQLLIEVEAVAIL